jgi:hypothetical protein
MRLCDALDRCVLACRSRGSAFTFSLFSAPDTVSFKLGFNQPSTDFQCPAVRLSIVNAMNLVVSGSDILFTQLDSSPSTLLYVQCVNTGGFCATAVKNLFDLIQRGQIQLPYYVLFGVDPLGTVVRNPTPVFTFPLWAIGVIIGGVAAIGILILLLCILCSRSKGRRKRKPQKAPGYVPLQDDVETGLMSVSKEGVSGGDASAATAAGAAAGGADAGPKEDKELTFEVLFSIKKSDKPDGLIVGRKELVKVMQSDWDSRGEFVKATTSKGAVGVIPSTHLKQKK